MISVRGANLFTAPSADRPLNGSDPCYGQSGLAAVGGCVPRKLLAKIHRDGMDWHGYLVIVVGIRKLFS